jgi:hypothetical protein
MKRLNMKKEFGMNTKTLAKLSMLAIGTLLLAASASADPMTLPAYNTWETEPFTYMNDGDFFPDVFITGGSGYIAVTGYYETGDYYQVYDNGNLVLTTAQVSPVNVDYGDSGFYMTPATAITSGYFSFGFVPVAAGDWISIVDLYPPAGIGEVGVELLAPEPAAIVLLCILLLTLVLLERFRSVWRRSPRTSVFKDHIV